MSTPTSAPACPPPALSPSLPRGWDGTHFSYGMLEQAEALLRRWDTPLEATILSVVDREMTRDVDTMAVRMRPDGIVQLRVNPDFLVDIGVEGAAFVLCHEAMHLLLQHLRAEEPEDRAWALATEVVVNHWVLAHTGRDLPTSRRTGQPLGIDPVGVHQLYRSLAEHPVDYDAFVATDRVCAGHLRALADQLPEPGCEHAEASEDDGDPAIAGAIEAGLSVAVQRAADGDTRLARQLLALHDAAPEAPVWDRIGVAELRGTTRRLGEVGFWRTHLRAVVGRRLRPRMQVAYDRKVGWWDAALLTELGVHADPDIGMPLAPRADRDRRRNVAIYLDTSGSIGADTIEAVAATVGPIPETDIEWHTFDHEVHPFEPGEPLLGGGGTCFGAIVDDLAADESFPDAVLVLTDGWAPPITPPHPERWIWLLIDEHDDWPAAHGMQTVPVPTPAGAHR